MVVSCSDYLEDLSSYMDGELEQDRQTALTEHLTVCSQCQDTKQSFRGLSQIIGSASQKVQEQAPDLWSLMNDKVPGICECVQDDLSAYLDGELIPPAHEGVAQHLEACTVCLERFQGLSKVNNLLAKGLELPAGIEIDIWSKVKSRLNDDCLLIQSELSSYADREVATLRHRAITAHLLECGDCQGAFNQISDCGESLRNFYQPEIPESFDLWPQIQAKMNVIPLEVQGKVVPIRRLKPFHAVAAALALGVFAAAAVMLNHGPSVPPVTAENYMIDSTLQEPADIAEQVVYEHQ